LGETIRVAVADVGIVRSGRTVFAERLVAREQLLAQRRQRRRGRILGIDAAPGHSRARLRSGPCSAEIARGRWTAVANGPVRWVVLPRRPWRAVLLGGGKDRQQEN